MTEQDFVQKYKIETLDPWLNGHYGASLLYWALAYQDDCDVEMAKDFVSIEGIDTTSSSFYHAKRIANIAGSVIGGFDYE